MQDNVPAFGLKTVVVRDSNPLGEEPRFIRLRLTEL
jgi:hypothetical protein